MRFNPSDRYCRPLVAFIFLLFIFSGCTGGPAEDQQAKGEMADPEPEAPRAASLAKPELSEPFVFVEELKEVMGTLNFVEKWNRWVITETKTMPLMSIGEEDFEAYDSWTDFSETSPYQVTVAENHVIAEDKGGGMAYTRVEAVCLSNTRESILIALLSQEEMDFYGDYTLKLLRKKTGAVN